MGSANTCLVAQVQDIRETIEHQSERLASVYERQTGLMDRLNLLLQTVAQSFQFSEQLRAHIPDRPDVEP